MYKEKGGFLMESLKRSLAIFFSILVFGLLYIGNANEVKAYTAHN